jgi:hypothetical protein
MGQFQVEGMMDNQDLLNAAYEAADDWGRRYILETALAQVDATKQERKLRPKLCIVAPALVDALPNSGNRFFDGVPLPRVSPAIDGDNFADAAK